LGFSIMLTATSHTNAEPSAGSRQVETYSFSFLTGALYLTESLAVAEVARKCADWDKVVIQVSENNLLKQRKSASLTRLLREIRYRLQELSHDELEFLCDAGSRDQRQLLFVAICRRFRFIREFVVEVIRQKALKLDVQLYPADFARFFDQKGAESSEVENLTPKSMAKVKQVIIRMLAEAGLLDSTDSQRITRPVPSKALTRLIARTDPQTLRCLLLSDAEIRQTAI
jgi:hypothetical protein